MTVIGAVFTRLVNRHKPAAPRELGLPRDLVELVLHQLLDQRVFAFAGARELVTNKLCW